MRYDRQVTKKRRKRDVGQEGFKEGGGRKTSQEVGAQGQRE